MQIFYVNENSQFKHWKADTELLLTFMLTHKCRRDYNVKRKKFCFRSLNLIYLKKYFFNKMYKLFLKLFLSHVPILSIYSTLLFEHTKYPGTCSSCFL